MQIESQGLDKLIRNKEEYLRIFGDFINALYGKQFTLHTQHDIIELAELANYYRALPAVSRMLTESLVESLTWYPRQFALNHWLKQH